MTASTLPPLPLLRGYMYCRMCGNQCSQETEEQDICRLCSTEAGFHVREFNRDAAQRWTPHTTRTFPPRPCKRCEAEYVPHSAAALYCYACRPDRVRERCRDSHARRKEQKQMEVTA